MKRVEAIIMFAWASLVVLAICGGGCGRGGGIGNSTKLAHDRSTTYADGSAIPDAKIPTIVYRVYYSTKSTGPWTLFDTHVDNVMAKIPAAGLPASGMTMYYTCDATLDGVTSEMAKAISYSHP